MIKFILVFLLLVNIQLSAGNFEDGIDAIKSQDYKGAHTIFKSLADDGHSDAQNAMAYMYANGLGVEKDIEKAIVYAEKSVGSDKDNEDKILLLGSLYSMNEQYDKAIPIFEKLSEMDHLQAINTMFELYYDAKNEKYVKKDLKKAFHYAKKAADLGDPLSQRRTAVMYQNAIGTEKHILNAIKYYEKALENGDLLSGLEVANIYYYGLDTNRNLDKAIDIYKKVAQKGNAKAQAMLGVIYSSDKKDNITAEKWFKNAVNNKEDQINISFAQLEYGSYLISIKKYKEAFSLIESSAQSGNAYAIFNLALAYEHGRGIKQNFEKSLFWYKKAAELGDKEAIDIVNNSNKHFELTKKMYSNNLDDEVILYYTSDTIEDIKSIRVTSKEFDKKYNETNVYLTFNKNNRRLYAKVTFAKSDRGIWMRTNFSASSNKKDIY